MDYQGTISAYQNTVSKWVFKAPISFPEEFAQKRFLKKMERPTDSGEEARVFNAWDLFIKTDQTLPAVLLKKEWYKARALLHRVIRGNRRQAEVTFPKGSSLIPSHGFNSVEARLAQAPWTVTPDCFDDFCRLVYNHKALKRACERRYIRWFSSQHFNVSRKESDKILWRRLRDFPHFRFEVFRWKMSRIVKLVRGSRFSTVPKNNTVRRPINIEPLGNLFVQRQIGNFIRKCLKDQLNIDLDTLADVHRDRISDPVATIDLKNASDSFSMALVNFMLPKGLMNDIDSARSPLLFGHDKCYHYLRKVSSMGNGFTFELMTLILTCLCKVLDKDSSVFGDDIIIAPDKAPLLIELLTDVGLQVNTEKSFIQGPFRESCGGNYHDDHGYIESFDFLYPTSIADCATILSKLYLLRQYPSFRDLYYCLLRRTPLALRGGPVNKQDVVRHSWESDEVPARFACDVHLIADKHRNAVCKQLKADLQLKDAINVVEFEWVPSTRSSTTASMFNTRHWAKYEMYLAAGRMAKDVISGEGMWREKTVYYSSGDILRVEPPSRKVRVKG